jgi:hypothetical protein
MTYQDFKARYTGSRVDYDRVYAFQCVDLILQWCYENGIPSGVWGNAIDYANKPTAVFSQKFVRVSDYKQGDVIVLYGLSGNPYGHIGLLDSAPGDVVKLLEQNGYGSGAGTGRDAIGVYRDIPKSRVAAIYRLRSATATPPPPPARSTVFLPSTVRSWRLYPVGGSLVPGTEKARLAPYQFPPGLTYKIEAWVGDYAVVIQTQMFGRGTIWVKNTEAVIK